MSSKLPNGLHVFVLPVLVDAGIWRLGGQQGTLSPTQINTTIMFSVHICVCVLVCVRVSICVLCLCVGSSDRCLLLHLRAMSLPPWLQCIFVYVLACVYACIYLCFVFVHWFLAFLPHSVSPRPKSLFTVDRITIETWSFIERSAFAFLRSLLLPYTICFPILPRASPCWP